MQIRNRTPIDTAVLESFAKRAARSVGCRFSRVPITFSLGRTMRCIGRISGLARCSYNTRIYCQKGRYRPDGTFVPIRQDGGAITMTLYIPRFHDACDFERCKRALGLVGFNPSEFSRRLYSVLVHEYQHVADYQHDFDVTWKRKQGEMLTWDRPWHGRRGRHDERPEERRAFRAEREVCVERVRGSIPTPAEQLAMVHEIEKCCYGRILTDEESARELLAV